MKIVRVLQGVVLIDIMLPIRYWFWERPFWSAQVMYEESKDTSLIKKKEADYDLTN